MGVRLKFRSKPQLNDYIFQASQVMDQIKDEFGMDTESLFTVKKDFLQYREAEAMVEEAVVHLYSTEYYHKAYNLFKKAMEIKENLFNGRMPIKDHMILYLSAMRNCVYLEKYYEAIELGEQSIWGYDLEKVSEIAKKNDYFEAMVKKQIVGFFAELAKSYNQIDYYSEALACFKKAFLVFLDHYSGKDYATTVLIHNTGRSCYSLGNYQKAANCFEKVQIF